MGKTITITALDIKLEAQIHLDDDNSFDVLSLIGDDQNIIDLVGDKAMDAIREAIYIELQWRELGGTR